MERKTELLKGFWVLEADVEGYMQPVVKQH